MPTAAACWVHGMLGACLCGVVGGDVKGPRHYNPPSHPANAITVPHSEGFYALHHVVSLCDHHLPTGHNFAPLRTRHSPHIASAPPRARSRAPGQRVPLAPTMRRARVYRTRRRSRSLGRKNLKSPFQGPAAQCHQCLDDVSAVPAIHVPCLDTSPRSPECPQHATSWECDRTSTTVRSALAYRLAAATHVWVASACGGD